MQRLDIRRTFEAIRISGWVAPLPVCAFLLAAAAAVGRLFSPAAGGVLAATAPIAALSLSALQARERRICALRVVARANGLEVRSDDVVAGRIAECDVVIRREGSTSHITLADPSLSSVLLERPAKSAPRSLIRTGLPVGDAEFDRVFRIVADYETAVRIWARHRRFLLREGASLSIGGGFLRGAWKISGSVQNELQHLLDQALAVVRTIRSTEDIPSCLRTMVEGPSSSEQKRLALRFLLDRHGSSPETAAACRTARKDPDPALQVIAAYGLQDLDLLRQLSAEPYLDGVRAESISLLPRDEARGMIDALLRSKTAAAVALDAAARIGHRPLAVLVAAALSPNASFTAEALDHLERADGEIIALALTELVRRETRGPVLRKAFRILARIGDASAAAALRPHAESGLPGRLPGEAREAMRAIRARLEGSVGQLAIAPDDSGRGALSEAPSSGAVSLTKRTRASGEMPPDA